VTTIYCLKLKIDSISRGLLEKENA